MKTTEEIGNILSEKGLKVTPQRISVYKAIYNLHTHPTTDDIIEEVKKDNAYISNATVYNVLDSFVKKGIVERIKTDSDKMRYDLMLENHHHIYCSNSMEIMDFYSEDIDKFLEKYFTDNPIKNFNIKSIQLQINGEYE